MKRAGGRITAAILWQTRIRLIIYIETFKIKERFKFTMPFLTVLPGLAKNFAALLSQSYSLLI